MEIFKIPRGLYSLRTTLAIANPLPASSKVTINCSDLKRLLGYERLTDITIIRENPNLY